jgi:hypothetical protein
VIDQSNHRAEQKLSENQRDVVRTSKLGRRFLPRRGKIARAAFAQPLVNGREPRPLAIP